jgi:RNA polymerase sigma-70 factor (ECF subfamily)
VGYDGLQKTHLSNVRGKERLELSDNDLIKQYLSGDVSALDTLIRRYQKEAVRIAYTVLGNETDAMDAAQDAFIKVFRNLERFGGRSQFSTWLYRIVYNAALDLGRKRRRFVQHVEDEDSERQFEPPEDRHDGDAPEESLLDREQAVLVRKCMEQLPQKYSVVIRMKDIEGLSYEHIGQILGVSRGNVMSRLYYGREKLRRLIKKESAG